VIDLEKDRASENTDNISDDKKYADIEENKIKNDLILYLVTDRNTHGLVNYFRECGIELSNVYSTIMEARNALLMQSKPSRIVVVDTGLGKFTSTRTRQELIDMIGICDENNKVSVFYTDSVIKIDTVKKLENREEGLDWFKYKSTVDVLTTLLRYNETYKLDSRADEKDKILGYDDLYNIKGIRGSIDEYNDTSDEFMIHLGGISSQDLCDNMLNEDSGGDLLKAYKIRL